MAHRRLVRAPGHLTDAAAARHRAPPTPATWHGSCRCSSDAWAPTLPGVVERHAVASRVGVGRCQHGHVPGARGAPRAKPATARTAGQPARRRGRCGQPAADDEPGGVPAGLPGHPCAGPVRRRAALGRTGPRSPAVRGGEHPGHGTRGRGAPRDLPPVGLPPRDDARLRAGGPSLAASLPARAPGAAGGAVRRADAPPAATGTPLRRRPLAGGRRGGFLARLARTRSSGRSSARRRRS